MTLDEAFDRLIGHEKGFQNHHNDRGNWTSGVVGVGENRGTKYGISSMTYPNLDIKNLTLEDAKRIYQKDFWNRFRGEQMDSQLAFNVFDASVHHGVDTAIRLLQRALSVAEDGLVGHVTLAAAQTHDPQVIISRLNAHRILHCTKLSTWPSFGKGWVVRFANNILDGTHA